MPPLNLILSLLPGPYAVCRLASDAPLPAWATIEDTFVSITRTTEELSITCPQASVPLDVQHEGGWRVLKMEGPFDLSLTGILAPIASALAEAQVNLFVISTYDTDYVLVKDSKLQRAIEAIQGLGHRVNKP